METCGEGAQRDKQDGDRFDRWYTNREGKEKNREKEIFKLI